MFFIYRYFDFNNNIQCPCIHSSPKKIGYTDFALYFFSNKEKYVHNILYVFIKKLIFYKRKKINSFF